MTNPHEPHPHAQAVARKRHFQVIRPTEVPALIVVKVVAVGRNDGTRDDRDRCASKRNGSGIVSLAPFHEQQAVRKIRDGFHLVLPPRVREPKIRRIQNGR